MTFELITNEENKMEKKPWYTSKTIILNTLGTLLALFYPPAQEWIVAHPDLVAGIFAVVNIGLRFISKDKLSIS
jgi:hypothetical protein